MARLKLRVLDVLARSPRPLTVPEIAVAVRFYPIRGLYSYCRRLQRWGLLSAEYTAADKLAYRITERGRERLEWFRRRAA